MTGSVMARSCSIVGQALLGLVLLSQIGWNALVVWPVLFRLIAAPYQQMPAPFQIACLPVGWLVSFGGMSFVMGLAGVPGRQEMEAGAGSNERANRQGREPQHGSERPAAAVDHRFDTRGAYNPVPTSDPDAGPVPPSSTKRPWPGALFLLLLLECFTWTFASLQTIGDHIVNGPGVFAAALLVFASDVVFSSGMSRAWQMAAGPKSRVGVDAIEAPPVRRPLSNERMERDS